MVNALIALNIVEQRFGSFDRVVLQTDNNFALTSSLLRCDLVNPYNYLNNFLNNGF